MREKPTRAARAASGTAQSGKTEPYESATAIEAVAWPEGKEKRSGSRTRPGCWSLTEGRTRTTVRLTSCTMRCDTVSVTSARAEARCAAQQANHGSPAANTLGPVPPRWVAAAQVARERHGAA